MKPLFVPLKAEYFDAFADGSKTEELRRYGPRWNERTCAVGRRVVLSKGYGKAQRLNGRIWKFKKQHGSTFGSTYRASIQRLFGTLDIDIACIGIDLTGGNQPSTQSSGVNRGSAAPTASDRDDGAGLAAVGNDTTVAKTETASLPSCVILARSWMEAYVRSQETFDTRELDAFGYDAADLLGSVVLEYEQLAASKATTEVSSSPAASPAQKDTDLAVPDPLRGHDAEPRLNSDDGQTEMLREIAALCAQHETALLVVGEVFDELAEFLCGLEDTAKTDEQLYADLTERLLPNWSDRLKDHMLGWSKYVNSAERASRVGYHGTVPVSETGSSTQSASVKDNTNTLASLPVSEPSGVQDKNDVSAALLPADPSAGVTTEPLPNRLGIEGLRPVDPAVVREFERAMTEEVIPQAVEALREREIAWNQIKDRPLTSWTPEYLAAKAEEVEFVERLRARGESNAADLIVKLRADFETEREMHNAWRKRAEEAEAQPLLASVRHRIRTDGYRAPRMPVSTSERMAFLSGIDFAVRCIDQALQHPVGCASVSNERSESSAGLPSEAQESLPSPPEATR